MKGKNMHKQLSKNKKAISSLMLILLLLISAIIGGIISYLWVTGYYISLKEKIPEGNTAVITNLLFDPQNATAFNVTVLNPSFSPDDNIQVERIALSEKTGGFEGKLSFVTVSIPTLPFPISRGEGQTFACRGDWTPYLNKTVIISVFVTNGAGSTNEIKLPYTNLNITTVDFNPSIGIRNFTITLRNDQNSATYLNVTKIVLDSTEFNSTHIPSLPSLAPNTTAVLTINYNWSDYATLGGSHQISVLTKQGYSQLKGVEIPKVAFSVQEMNFDPADMKHFNFTVKNQVSTNAYLNVSIIEVTANSTTIDLTSHVTPPLNSSTNGVLSNSTATFTCEWNWTNYRNKDAVLTVQTLQGFKAKGVQTIMPAAQLSITEEPVFPDTGHFFVTVKNSEPPRSIKTANVTRIQVQFENGSLMNVTIAYPLSGPYLIEIGKTIMFSCAFNWESYLNKTITIFIYTNESILEPNTSITTKTPANASNYQVYLTVPSANFNPSNTTRFNATINDSLQSTRNATITRITVMLEDGTEINATCISHTLPFTLITNSTDTFTCEWTWTTYRNKDVTIRVYTDEGLRAFYIAKTPS
jgi:hypothetical protein